MELWRPIVDGICCCDFGTRCRRYLMISKECTSGSTCSWRRQT